MTAPHTIRPEKWQAGGGFEDVGVATDGRTVGWVADQMLTPQEGGTNYSYAVALRLEIWRDGQVIRNFSAPAFVIQDWASLKHGTEVAIHVAPPHGEDTHNCILFDVNTGEELAHWASDSTNSAMPKWAGRLFAGSAANP